MCLNKRNFPKKHACLRTIELWRCLNIEGGTVILWTLPSKIIGGPPRNPPPGTYAYVFGRLSDIDYFYFFEYQFATAAITIFAIAINSCGMLSFRSLNHF